MEKKAQFEGIFFFKLPDFYDKFQQVDKNIEGFWGFSKSG